MSRTAYGSPTIALGSIALLFPLTILGSAGGREVRPAPQEAITRDSAGVSIVQHPHSVGRPDQQWAVSPEPLISIGELDGPEEYTLWFLTGATLLSDGGFVLGLGGSDETIEIRYFDREGGFLSRTSGYGEGPGEFKLLVGLFPVPGDSVLAYGYGNRFWVFDKAGKLGRGGRMGPPIPFTLAGLVTPDLALGSWPEDPRIHVTAPNLHRPVRHYLLAGVDSRTLDTLATLPGAWMYYRENRYVYEYPFGSETHAVAGQGRIWVGMAEEDEVRGYTPEGKLVTIIRGLWAGTEVTRDLRNRYKKETLDRFTGETQSRWRRHLRSVGFPESTPHYRNLKVDRLGNLWVQRYRPFWSRQDHEWKVFDQGGAFLAHVTVPLEVLGPCAVNRADHPCDPILEIGEDYVLIGHRDELGVDRVKKHLLERGGPGSG